MAIKPDVALGLLPITNNPMTALDMPRPCTGTTTLRQDVEVGLVGSSGGNFGEEMGPYAPFWAIYLEESRRTDNDMVGDWKDSVDALLQFAGLFSAVVTTFVVELGKRFEVDYDAANNSLLARLVDIQAQQIGGGISDMSPNHLGTSFTLADHWAYGLWMASLFCSISAALMATMVRQWIQYYIATPPGTLQDRARIRNIRFTNLERWSVHTVVRIIPFALHVAVLFFLCGLSLFLLGLNKTIAIFVASATIVMFTLYTATALLSLAFPHCPYRTPLAGWLYCHYLYFCRARCWFDRLRPINGQQIHYPKESDFAWPQSREAKDNKIQSHTNDVSALMWMLDSSNVKAQIAAAQAICGLRTNEKLWKKLVKRGVHTSMIQIIHNHAPLPDPTATGTARLFWSSIHVFMSSIDWQHKIPGPPDAQQQLLQDAFQLMPFFRSKPSPVGLDGIDSSHWHPVHQSLLASSLHQSWDDPTLFPDETLFWFLRIFFEVHNTSTSQARDFLHHLHTSPSLATRFGTFLAWIVDKEPKLYKELISLQPQVKAPIAPATACSDFSCPGPSRSATRPGQARLAPPSIFNGWPRDYRRTDIALPTPQIPYPQPLNNAQGVAPSSAPIPMPQPAFT